eukprot:UN29667
MEYLSSSLYDIIEMNKRTGLAIDHIQVIAKQLFNLLNVLAKHGITHTDIKHKNVCLVNSTCHIIENPKSEDLPLQMRKSKKIENLDKYYHLQYPIVKLIDYGNATHSSAPHPVPIHTRQFRA